jgi:hypothetical protein
VEAVLVEVVGDLFADVLRGREDPATTVALIGLDAVVGIRGEVPSAPTWSNICSRCDQGAVVNVSISKPSGLY